MISQLLIQVGYPLRYCVVLIKQAANKEDEGGSSPTRRWMAYFMEGRPWNKHGWNRHS